MVFRVYVEKKPGFDVEAQQLANELTTILGIKALKNVRLVNRYDVEGISEELFRQADEKQRIPLFRIAREVYTGEVIPPDSDDFISNENLFRYQAKIIRELAATRNCVIVGRCANFILRGRDNVLNVFVTAPVVDCVRRVMETDGLNVEEAEKKIKKIDKRRADYFKYFTGRQWQDAALYDLCLNTGHMSEQKCVDIVRAYMDARFE